MSKGTPTSRMWIGLGGAAGFLCYGIAAFWFHTVSGRASSHNVTPRSGEVIGIIYFALALALLVFAWRGYLDRKAEKKENSK
jgi:hypothetical protein